MKKSLTKTFITLCLTVTLFFVVPVQAGIFDGIIDFVQGIACEFLESEAVEYAEDIIELIPGAGLFVDDMITQGISLICGKGTSVHSPEMLDYEDLLIDIRDIFREELQDAFNNDNVEDAYADITGAIEFLVGSNRYDLDLYRNDLSNARIQIQMALKDLEEVGKNLVEQGVETKSLVLGPYETGIGGLISCFQEIYWVVSQTNNLEARQYFFEQAVPIIQEKINKLEDWVSATREYIRSGIRIVQICEYVDFVPPQYICFPGFKAYTDSGIIEAWATDTASALQKINKKVDDYVYWEMTPTLLASEVLIGLWRESLKGDWMLPIYSPNPYLPYHFPTSIPLLAISSGINYPNSLVSQKMRLTSGWNMISLPVIPENPLLSKLFPDAVIVYGYEKGIGYVHIKANEKLEVGRGYWILLNEKHIYTLRGQPIKEFALPVQNGWYMVGACSSSAKTSTRNGKIKVIYNYSPGLGYQRIPQSDNLQPGQGYWINISNVVYKAN